MISRLLLVRFIVQWLKSKEESLPFKELLEVSINQTYLLKLEKGWLSLLDTAVTVILLLYPSMRGKDTELTCSLLTQFIMQTRYIKRESNVRFVVNGSDVHRKLKGECNWKLNCLFSVWLISRQMIIEVIKGHDVPTCLCAQGFPIEAKDSNGKAFPFLNIVSHCCTPCGKGKW